MDTILNQNENFTDIVSTYFLSKDKADEEYSALALRDQMLKIYDLYGNFPTSSFYIVGEVRFDDKEDLEQTPFKEEGGIYDPESFFDGKARFVPLYDEEVNILVFPSIIDALKAADGREKKEFLVDASTLYKLFFNGKTVNNGISIRINDHQFQMSSEEIQAIFESPELVLKNRNELLAFFDNLIKGANA